MALIPYPDSSQLSDQTRAKIDAFEREHGRPSLFRLMLAWFPPALDVADAAYHPMMTGGSLPRWFKEVLFTAASTERDCFY